MAALLLPAGPQWLHAGGMPQHLLQMVGADLTPSGGKEAPADGNTREVWTGSLYSSTYRAGVCTKPDGRMSGVLFLQLANGDVDVYHVEGQRQADTVFARHHSGHSFTGRLASPSEIRGDITLKNGMSISLKGQRWPQAALPKKTPAFSGWGTA